MMPLHARLLLLTVAFLPLVACADDPSPASTAATATPEHPTATSAPAATSNPSGQPAYELVATWGERAPLVMPSDVAVLPNGTLVVSDLLLNHLALFAPDGSPAGQLPSPGAVVATDLLGRIYAPVYEPGLRIERYAPDGAVEATYVLMETAESRPTFELRDIVVDASRRVYALSGIAPNAGISPLPFIGIKVFAPTGELLATWQAPPDVQPQAVTIDYQGTVWVVVHSQRDGYGLIAVDPDAYDASIWERWTIAIGPTPAIAGLAATPDGRLFAVSPGESGASDRQPARLVALDPTAGTVQTFAIDGYVGAPVGNTLGIAARSNRTLLLTDPLGPRVIAVDQTGAIVDEIGAPGPGHVVQPSSLTVGPDGAVYVPDPAQRVIHVFTLDGTLHTTLPLGDDPWRYEAAAVAIASDGTRYELLSPVDDIRVVAPDGALVETWREPAVELPGGQMETFDPGTLAVTADGRVHLGWRFSATIRSYAPDRQSFERWDVPDTVTHVVALAASGNDVWALVYAEPAPGASRVAYLLRRAPNGTLTTVLEIAQNQDDDDLADAFPFGLAVTGDGNIVVADLITRDVTLYGTDGDEITRWNVGEPDDERRRTMFVAATAGGEVLVLDEATRQVRVYAPAD